MSRLRKYSFAWVTMAFLLVSIAGHWLFGWFAYVDAQHQHNAPVEVSGYTIEMLRDTFENWQSEFLQLLWQVAGLTMLMYVGSPQSKESEQRSEEILEAILRQVDPDAGEKIAKLNEKYPKE